MLDMRKLSLAATSIARKVVCIAACESWREEQGRVVRESETEALESNLEMALYISQNTR